MGDAKLPVEPPFPVEIWERVIRFCSGSDLLRVRRVCSRWNGIVAGCPALRQKLSVRFENQSFREGLDINKLPPAAKAWFSGCKIQSVDGWWSEFGRNLTELYLNKCQIGTAMLFRMLRGCPNLKELTLRGVNLACGQRDAVDFELNAMENIDMYDVKFEERFVVLDWFRQILPRLKHFSLRNSFVHFGFEKDTDRLIQLLENVKGTLETLNLTLDDKLLEQLYAMGPLQITRATYHIIGSLPGIDLWTKFCQNQPYLQRIHLYNCVITDEALDALVTNSPNLKVLSTDLVSFPQNVPTFLSHLINVECVKIGVICHSLTFSSPLSSSLKTLTIFGATIVDGVTFLMNSPHLHELFLLYCTLTKCPIPPAIQMFSNLKHLRLSCGISQNQLDYVVRCHPALESVEFHDMKLVRIATIVALLLHSPKLHKVRLSNCSRIAAGSTGEEIMRQYYREHGSAEGTRDVCFEIL